MKCNLQNQRNMVPEYEKILQNRLLTRDKIVVIANGDENIDT